MCFYSVLLPITYYIHIMCNNDSFQLGVQISTKVKFEDLSTSEDKIESKTCHMSVHLYAVKKKNVSAISLIIRTGQVIFVLYCLGASNVTEVYAYS